jgi:hypothetical protein
VKSTSRDEPWLRVSALTVRADVVALGDVAQHAAAMLSRELREVGASVDEWESVELLSEAEMRRRAQRPAIPPMVDATGFADLAGLTRQRIYQYESDRRAGKRGDFPAPVLDGYWLRAVAGRWSNTRRRKPRTPRRTRRVSPRAITATSRSDRRLLRAALPVVCRARIAREVAGDHLPGGLARTPARDNALEGSLPGVRCNRIRKETVGARLREGRLSLGRSPRPGRVTP